VAPLGFTDHPLGTTAVEHCPITYSSCFVFCLNGTKVAKVQDRILHSCNGVS
jgi:hypothetical protein